MLFLFPLDLLLDTSSAGLNSLTSNWSALKCRGRMTKANIPKLKLHEWQPQGNTFTDFQIKSTMDRFAPLDPVSRRMKVARSTVRKSHRVTKPLSRRSWTTFRSFSVFIRSSQNFTGNALTGLPRIKGTCFENLMFESTGPPWKRKSRLSCHPRSLVCSYPWRCFAAMAKSCCHRSR